MILNAQSLGDLFSERVELSSDEVALWFKDDGEFQSLTWKEVGDWVASVASWLREQGVGAGDAVASFASNHWKWVITDQAIYSIGAVHVPIHAPLTGNQASFQIADSRAKALVLDGSVELEKLAAFNIDLPTLVFSGATSVGATGSASEKTDQGATSGGATSSGATSSGATSSGATGSASEYKHQGPIASSLSKRCQPWQSLPRASWQGVIAPRTSDDIATILYTSGTTGEPKGVVLSHNNLLTNVVGTLQSIGQRPADIRLGFLPLSHIFARTCDLYTWIAGGSQFAIAESRETVLADCQSIRPQILNGVPYFFDRVRRYLVESTDELADDALRNLFGGEIRFCCSGGAALPDHVFDFYQANNVPLLQGYGLTETSPVITLSTETSYRRGAVGRAIAGVDIRIAEDGEVQTRGPHVMQGYFGKPDATAEVLRDGWFSTGDLGRLDDDGFLYITGRKKELIVTSGGKNIAPVLLESLLTEDPLIAQAVVIGDDEKYLSALIVPDMDALRASLHGESDSEDVQTLDLQSTRTVGLILEAVAERLVSVSHYEQVKKVFLTEEPFTVENGMLTPKLTLRRGVICEHYADRIDQMYGRLQG